MNNIVVGRSVGYSSNWCVGEVMAFGERVQSRV